jgi:hypothetical protein
MEPIKLSGGGGGGAGGGTLKPGAGGITDKVMGMVCGSFEAPGEEIVTTAAYAPMASALGFTESVRLVPPVPAAGETVSHDEFVDAVQDRLEPVALAIEIVCGAGRGAPTFQSN